LRWSSDVTGSCITGYDVTGSCITGYDVTGNDVTGNDVTETGNREPETGNEREIISRVFVPVFPAFFPELLLILGTNNGIVNQTCIESL
jgi:hypothetical protein